MRIPGLDLTETFEATEEQAERRAKAKAKGGGDVQLFLCSPWGEYAGKNAISPRKLASRS